MYKKFLFLTSFVLVLSLACTSYGADPCMIKLDFNNTADNNDANTEEDFLKFSLANNGSEVNGVVIDLVGNLRSARRAEPNGPTRPTDPYLNFDLAFRDFINAISRNDMTIMLHGLGVDRDYDVYMWAYDHESTPTRSADWAANGSYLFTVDFNGGLLNWPPDIDWYWQGTAQTDKYGRLILEATRHISPSPPPESPAGEPYAFVNALKIVPKGTFTATKYAQRPVPFDGTQNVPVTTSLKWRKGAPVTTVKHDLYFGTDEAAVTNATRALHPGVDIYRQDLANDANKGFDPCGTTGFLKLGKTYYWRIDEDTPPLNPPGEVWSFKTLEYSVNDNFDSYPSSTDLKVVWEDYWVNGTTAEVFTNTAAVRSGQSMKYVYNNKSYAPYYAEANAAVASLGLDPNWLGMEAKALSLWFYGDPCNPVGAHDEMYMKLVDNDNNAATVGYSDYGDKNNLRKKSWTEWNIPLEDFSDNLDATNIFDANVTDSNSPTGVTGSSNGYGSAWYYYPESRWWNIWLDNGRYDRHRKKDIWITLYVKRRNVGQPAKVTFLTGGATVEWMTDPNGSIRPPLPSDTPTLEMENLYIDRTAHEPNVFYPTATYQVVNLHIVLPRNPRWVFLDIRGYNFDIMGGSIRHRCRRGLNPRKVKNIIIGFGDGTPAVSDGNVLFEDIRLYATRCALAERSADIALVDYAPGGTGDCVVDYQEILVMGDTWLLGDEVFPTKDPGNDNLVLYYPLNEGDGNVVDPTAGNGGEAGSLQAWRGTTWNSTGNNEYPIGTKGVYWSDDHAPGIGGSACLYINGGYGSVVSCGTYGQLGLGISNNEPDSNKITLSCWTKWLGRRNWDSYLAGKSQGLLGKRGGWDDASVLWMLEADTGGGGNSFGLRHGPGVQPIYPDLYAPANRMLTELNKWAHIAATYNGSTHTATLYVNGSQVGTTGQWRFSNGTDENIFLTIGCTMDINAWPNACPESYNGYIDEVRIYNRDLNQAEIAYLADSTPGDGKLTVPPASLAEVYKSEPAGEQIVNFKDLAIVAKKWLEQDMFP